MLHVDILFHQNNVATKRRDTDSYPRRQVDTLSAGSAAADQNHSTLCSAQGFSAPRPAGPPTSSDVDIHMDESKEAVAKRVAINSVIAYGIFGAVQVFYRLWKGWTTSSRMREMLKDMPATTGKGHDAPRGWIKDLQANLHRLQDWRLEICEGRPISKNLGFSWFPGAYTLMANDPAIVRHILKDEFNKYTKSDNSINPLFYYVEDFLGSGIFVVQHGVGSKDDGREWSHMRKVSAQVFNRKNFNSMMQDVFIEKAEVLRHFLETKFLPKSGNIGDAYVVDIQSCFFNFTFDSIMRIFFLEKTPTPLWVKRINTDRPLTRQTWQFECMDLDLSLLFSFSVHSSRGLLVEDMVAWPVPFMTSSLPGTDG